MKTIKKQNSYNQTIKDNVIQYLDKFPKETEKLSSLVAQLNNHDENICSRKNFTGHLTGSALFWNPLSNKVLLIHHKSLDLWIQPGGHLDHLEKPVAGALREFKEEINLSSVRLHDWHLDHLLPLDVDTHFIPANKPKGEPSHFHHDFLYLVVPEYSSYQSQSGDFKIDYLEKELKGYKWVSLEQLTTGPYEKKLQRTALKIMELDR